MPRCFVGLGANLGDRLAHLRAGVAALRAVAEVRALSSVFETAPVGGPPQPDYLNAVAELAWPHTPHALLAQLHTIEARAGRRRTAGARNAPRTLDLDLLLFGDAGEVRVASPALTLPHPRLHLRAFVLAPLAELAPELTHPTLGERIITLADGVNAGDGVRVFGSAALLAVDANG